MITGGPGQMRRQISAGIDRGLSGGTPISASGIFLFYTLIQRNTFTHRGLENIVDEINEVSSRNVRTATMQALPYISVSFVNMISV